MTRHNKRSALVPIAALEHGWLSALVSVRVAMLNLPTVAKAKLPKIEAGDVERLRELVRETFAALRKIHPEGLR